MPQSKENLTANDQGQNADADLEKAPAQARRIEAVFGEFLHRTCRHI